MKQKKLQTLIIITTIISLLSLTNIVSAVSVGTGILDEIEISDSEPYVFICGDRAFLDDGTEPGRISRDGEPLVERTRNYIFEGEQLVWDVLVVDMEGIDKIEGVDVTMGDNKDSGNDIESNCIPYTSPLENIDLCNTNFGEYKIKKFDPQIMKYYSCVLTAETPESMYGEYWVTVETRDNKGSKIIMDESEQWFFNPAIALSVDYQGDLFENLEAGKISYSKNISVRNSADQGSGVLLDMFISGSNFRPDDNSAFCLLDDLNLNNFRYFAKNREYDTIGLADSDSEGYRPFKYGTGFHDPDVFYNNYEIIPKNQVPPYYSANIIDIYDATNEEMNLKLKIDIPPLCKGKFDGYIFVWGESV